MATNAVPQAAQDGVELHSPTKPSTEQERSALVDTPIDPILLQFRHPDISAGAGVDLENNCRTLITAIRRTQSPMRSYGAIRIFAIVMWKDGHPLSGQPGNLIHGVSTLPADQVLIYEGEPCQVWTVPNDLITQRYLDGPAKVIGHVRAVANHYAGLAYPDFRSGLVGVYEDVVDDGPGLVVAVLMLGDLWCPSFMNTTARKRGLDGLFKHEVEIMLEDQFEPPILRSCILDAFDMVESMVE